MLSFGILCHVALVRTNVLEEHSTSIIRVTRICELGTTLAITSNRRMLQRNTVWKTLVLTRATRCNAPEGGVLHSQPPWKPQMLHGHYC
jgi:hypothetical protein